MQCTGNKQINKCRYNPTNDTLVSDVGSVEQNKRGKAFSYSREPILMYTTTSSATMCGLWSVLSCQAYDAPTVPQEKEVLIIISQELYQSTKHFILLDIKLSKPLLTDDQWLTTSSIGSTINNY